jgi:hypothetical protein
MDEPRDIEAWADALLDAHRTAPPATWSSPQEAERALRELPLAHRLMIRNGGRMPEPHEVDRIRRSGASFRRFEAAGAIFTIVGTLALAAFAIAFYSNF